MFELLTVPLPFFFQRATEKKQTDSHTNLYPLFQRALLFLQRTYSSLEKNLPSYVYSCGIVLSLIGLVSSIFLHGIFTPLLFTALAIICFIAKYLQKDLVKENTSLKEDLKTQNKVVLNLSETLVQKEMFTEELSTHFTEAKKQLIELTNHITTSLARFQETLHSEGKETRESLKEFFASQSPLVILNKLDELLKLSVTSPETLAKIIKQNTELLELTKAIYKKTHEEPKKTVVDNEGLV